MRVETKGPRDGDGIKEMLKCHFCESDEVNGMSGQERRSFKSISGRRHRVAAPPLFR